MELTGFPNGTVQFIPGQEGREETKETHNTGNTTVNIINAPIEPTASCFEVSFFISCSHNAVEQTVQNHFHLKTIVPGGPDQTYLEIENSAAQELPALLRELADAIQTDIDRLSESGND